MIDRNQGIGRRALDRTSDVPCQSSQLGQAEGITLLGVRVLHEVAFKEPDDGLVWIRLVRLLRVVRVPTDDRTPIVADVLRASMAEVVRVVGLDVAVGKRIPDEVGVESGDSIRARKRGHKPTTIAIVGTTLRVFVADPGGDEVQIARTISRVTVGAPSEFTTKRCGIGGATGIGRAHAV